VDFGDFTKLILRRWYVAAPLLIATVVAIVLALVTVKPNYILTSYVQLVPSAAPAGPATTTTPTAQHTNPWNQLGLGSLSQAAMFATQDQTFLDKLKASGKSTDIVMAVGYPNPVLTITVTAATSKQAEGTTDAVVQQYIATTASLQAQYNVKPEDMITTQRLDQGQNIVPTNSKLKKYVIFAGGGGILLTLALTIAVDAIIRRRGRNGGRPVFATPQPGSSPPVNGTVPDSAKRPVESSPIRGTAGRATSSEAAEAVPAPSDATVVMTLPKWSTGDHDSEPR
jgi:hypothetical protein